MLKDYFYVAHFDENDWYQVRVAETHYCIGSGPNLQELLGTVYRYIRTYKNEGRITKALSSLSDGGWCGENTYEQRSREYEKGIGNDYVDIVAEVVEKALYENRQDTPYRRAKKKVKSAVKKPVENQVKTLVEEVSKKVIRPQARKIKLIG